MKLLVMTGHFNINRNSVLRSLLACTWLLLWLSGISFGQERIMQNSRSKIVVLDPGHGGNDTGAAGNQNLLEKEVVMTFSRILAQNLKTRYRVFLTRTDDYNLSFEERIAKSNHVRADLFISIHTGGSTLRHVEGMSIFYYDGATVSGSAVETLPGNSPPDPLKYWGRIDPLHIEKSRYFAELIKQQLLGDWKNLDLTIAGAPLIIAVGADMPTLLVEIGTLTNPGDAESLNNTKILEGYADSIAKALDAFFSDQLHL